MFSWCGVDYILHASIIESDEVIGFSDDLNIDLLAFIAQLNIMKVISA